MDLLELEALLIRNKHIRPLLTDKEVDPWTALAMVVAPSPDLLEASLRAAMNQGISDLAKSLKDEFVPESIEEAIERVDIVKIEDLAAA